MKDLTPNFLIHTALVNIANEIVKDDVHPDLLELASQLVYDYADCKVYLNNLETEKIKQLEIPGLSSEPTKEEEE